MSNDRHISCELKVLNSHAYSYEHFMKAWATQPRDIHLALHKYCVINTKFFDFLDISSRVVDDKGTPKVELTSSKYIGCIPTLSPKGRCVGNISIEGNFKEDISELLSMIGESPMLEYKEDFKLSSGAIDKPPLYFECLKFIDKYLEAMRYKWRKFENKEFVEMNPSSSTNWMKYALSSIDPYKRLYFPNKKNLLTKEHVEWQEINYVLDVAVTEVLSPTTPAQSRFVYKQKIESVQKAYDKSNIKWIKSLPIHMSDPAVIKELKIIGNRILLGKACNDCAWRIDLAEFFERYVQFLFKEVAKGYGAKVYCNPQFSIKGYDKPNWALKYIEPDVVIERNGIQYIIDAKYKSHMYNFSSSSEKLKDVFRSDFLQVLAYSSFTRNIRKNVMLIYPAQKFSVKEMKILSSINDCSTNAYLIGIPLQKSMYFEVKKGLSDLVSF